MEDKLFKKIRWQLFLLGRLRIPMIGYTGLKLLELNDTTARVKVRLRRRTRNHLNSMYFGAMAIGADVASGIHAFYFASKHNQKVSFAFKGMSAEFIKRAETDCIFICDSGAKIEQAILSSLESGDRVNLPTQVQVLNTHQEEVARFEMIVSVKVKS